jgi:hypothetical protein
VANDRKIPGGLRAPPLSWPVAPVQGAIGIAYVIRAGKKPKSKLKIPSPTRRKRQFVQLAIVAVQAAAKDGTAHSLPDKLNHKKLWRDVNALLQSDPAFAKFREEYAGESSGRVLPVSRRTVIEALQMLRQANRAAE